MLAAGVVAAAFQPVRSRVQRGVNRLLYGTRDDPYEVVRELGRLLAASGPPGDVLDTLAASIREALRVPHVRIEAPGEQGRTLAQAGQTVAASERLPLVNQGETVGWLVIALRAGDDELSNQDRKLLDDLTHHVAVALRAALLEQDVQRSREALRLALEEERRRIRRDVHDGLGPSLATVVLGLERLRNTGVGGTNGAVDLVTELKEQTQEAIGGMRALIDGLRPSPLDNLDLVAAIRLHGERLCSQSCGQPLAFTVDAPVALPELPAAVEVAAYRIAMEALTNVVRHAGATKCTVRIAMDGQLRLQIVDDGVGLPPAYIAGVGLRSMRERSAELGGTATVTGLDRGTSVSVVIPLAGS